jgi:hypothetical protein
LTNPDANLPNGTNDIDKILKIRATKHWNNAIGELSVFKNEFIVVRRRHKLFRLSTD